MIGAAISVVDSRLSLLANQENASVYIEHGSITEEFGEGNAVEVSFKVRRYQDNIQEYLGNLRSDVLGKPLDIPDNPSNPDCS